MNTKYDVIIIGGGILGTFHAYHALLLGLKVCLVEKDSNPRSATTRNFGQVVPSGMNTKWQEYGRESLKVYKKIQSLCDISVRQNGTIYFASNEEEEQLLVELRAINHDNEYSSKMMTKHECLRNYPGVKETYVKAGLFFPEEVTVEPQVMVHRLQEYLVKNHSLQRKTKFLAMCCEEKKDGIEVCSSHNEKINANKVLICNGTDFKHLYPHLFEDGDLEVSKLQMMQTKPQHNYTLKGSVLTGESIRRYEAFQECPSYTEIKKREVEETLQKKWGIHILFKQAKDGSIIIGDSHEYADAACVDELGYDLDMGIDAFMLQEAKKIMHFPNYDIHRRWYGMYSQCKASDIFTKTVGENVHIITGIGGKGMTGSAGFAKQNIATIFNRVIV